MCKLLILNKVVKKDLMRKYNLHRDLKDMGKVLVSLMLLNSFEQRDAISGLTFLKLYSSCSAVSKVLEGSSKLEDGEEDTTFMWAGNGFDLDAGGKGGNGKK